MVEPDPSPEQFRALMLGEEPDLDEIMACVFSIQHHAARTYEALLEHPGSTVEELAAELDRDRSNVNRSLLILREKGLASRERRLLDGGGHVYQYSGTPLPEARELMHETLDAWAEYVHGRIDEFGNS
jgi:predicted transcriptional regulator